MFPSSNDGLNQMSDVSANVTTCDVLIGQTTRRKWLACLPSTVGLSLHRQKLGKQHQPYSPKDTNVDENSPNSKPDNSKTVNSKQNIDAPTREKMIIETLGTDCSIVLHKLQSWHPRCVRIDKNREPLYLITGKVAVIDAVWAPYLNIIISLSLRKGNMSSHDMILFNDHSCVTR